MEFMLLNSERRVTVGGLGSDYEGYTSMDIQAAVDGLRAGGGQVVLKQGKFLIYGPVRLYDNISLIGSGPDTVLYKVDGASTRMMVDADYGELRIEAEDSSQFEVGMGVQIFDQSQRWGWDESTAIITDITNNRLLIDRHLDRDYYSEEGGTVTNACSIIEAVSVNRVRIEQMTIDGNRAYNYAIGGCRAGGIYLHKSRNVHIEHIKVTNYHGDGISWQITEDITVNRCSVIDCAGSVLHPGAGSLRTRVTETECTRNGHAGLFICWRVQKGEFQNNRFMHNREYGISIGHKDSYNKFEANVITNNGHGGIYFRKEKASNGANGNLWERNVIEDNGDEEIGYGVYVEPGSTGNRMKNNLIGSNGRSRRSTGIYFASTAAEFDLLDNRFVGVSVEISGLDEPSSDCEKKL